MDLSNYCDSVAYNCQLTMCNHLTLNPISLDIMCKLLDLPSYDGITSELEAISDIELLFDFILCVCAFHMADSCT